MIKKAQNHPETKKANLNTEQMCGWYEISRQSYYQQSKRECRREAENQQVVEMVQGIRQRHPRMGTRKLLVKLEPAFKETGIQIGRDRLFDLLAQYDLLVPRSRKKHRTTWPGKWRCENLLKDLEVTHTQQAWVCDITYLETETVFCYLSLVTDAHSRFIVGYDVSESLAVEGAMRALNMAIRQATLPLKGLIHHSDHGIQYTCHAYRQRLGKFEIQSSMGEIGNCYDNAMAERVNGILKLEYMLGQRFVDTRQAQLATRQAIHLYNYERPHLALSFKTPSEVHTCS